MPLLRHGEFIAKMARYEAAGTWKNYRAAHANDPRIEALSEETHNAVVKLGEVIDLSSVEAMRKDLCAKFSASPNNGAMKFWTRGIRKSAVIKAMIASGLNWFELDDRPYIHWNEKP